ncbi:MAG: prepilin-type N-terminal cleavage/methylation domain-containing protein, partial [Deferribacteraceae bacterium]|nr:prepilin-type N-terminal cleavage/methylation domain-containing protein [Deferribacteraceae bacterium]
MREKKGFTIYELAIVLIIIGLVMAIVLKVNTIIDVAKLKRECAKFENMRSAFTVYYKQYKGLPGAENTGFSVITLADSKAAEAALLKSGLLNENDFKVGLKPASDKNYRYYFTRCIADDGS